MYYITASILGVLQITEKGEEEGGYVNLCFNTIC